MSAQGEFVALTLMDVAADILRWNGASDTQRSNAAKGLEEARAEVAALKEQHADLLAVAECDEALYQYDAGEITYEAREVVLTRHGKPKGAPGGQWFVNRLRRTALAKVRGEKS